MRISLCLKINLERGNRLTILKEIDNIVQIDTKILKRSLHWKQFEVNKKKDSILCGLSKIGWSKFGWRKCLLWKSWVNECLEWYRIRKVKILNFKFMVGYKIMFPINRITKDLMAIRHIKIYIYNCVIITQNIHSLICALSWFSKFLIINLSTES